MNIQRLTLVCFLSVLLPAAAFAGKKPPVPELKDRVHKHDGDQEFQRQASEKC